MIRFMQESAAFKKYVLSGILVVIIIAMAWYLVPSFTGQGMGFANNVPVVATVMGQDITSPDVLKQARTMIEQQYPNMASQAAMLVPMVAPQAMQQIILRHELVAEANRLGLRATDDDVRDYLRTGPLGQTIFPNGTFIGQNAYEDFASRAGYTVPQLEAAIKEDILITKLRALETAGASVADADVRKQFEKENTKVKFDYAVIKKEDVLKTIHPAEAELKAYYDRNKQAYVNSIPEKRQIKYVVFDNVKMLAQTQVTQQDLETYYDQHREEYRVPGQVEVRQILIKKPLPGNDGKVDQKAVDAARAKADDVLKQLKSGAKFEDLAKKYSEDTGTAKNGGSLGWVKPDAFPVPAVSQAVASLPKAGTSDVIDGGYAFVILHLDDKQDAHLKSLDEVKAQIEPLIKQQKAGQAAQRESDQLLSQARSATLEKAAAAKGLQVISTDFVSSKDVLPGIGADPQFTTAVFSQPANAPPDQAQLRQGFAIYQVAAVKPPQTPTFEEIKDKVEDAFKKERAEQLLSQKAQELSDRAKASHDLKKAAKESGAEFKTSDFVLPNGQVPELGSLTGPAAVAFTLKPGEISGPMNTPNTGVVLSVVERQAPTEADFAAKKDQIRESLLQAKRQELFAFFIDNLRDTMQKSGKVKINEKELQALSKPREEG
jgi:peptidyl-prolyl cis-trans isomerase D